MNRWYGARNLPSPARAEEGKLQLYAAQFNSVADDALNSAALFREYDRLRVMPGLVADDKVQHSGRDRHYADHTREARGRFVETCGVRELDAQTRVRDRFDSAQVTATAQCREQRARCFTHPEVRTGGYRSNRCCRNIRR